MARSKVLLTKDVPNLGNAGDVRQVAGGYARNYLIPRGMAVMATAGALKHAEEIRESGIRRRARERAHAESQAAVIKQQRLLFEAKAGENNRLYGSVTSAEIAEQLAGAAGFEIDRRRIHLEHPIRDLGIYNLELRLMPEVSATFAVAVVREGENWADAEKRAQEVAAAVAAETEELSETEEFLRETRIG